MACTLWDVLGSIADRRGRKGRQFPLQAILAIAIAAMLAGANDLRAIFRWGRRLKPEGLALFGIERRHVTPLIIMFFNRLMATPWPRLLAVSPAAARRPVTSRLRLCLPEPTICARFSAGGGG